MKSLSNIKSILLLAATGLIWTSTANAVPAFARKHDMNCSGCHTAYPQLNSVGRKFKEAGYRFATDDENNLNQEVSDFLQLEKHVPVSLIIKSRPYDKKDSGDDKIRAIHEVEAIVAGNISKNFSGWFELAGEDENDFSIETESAVLTYNYNEAFNIQAGRSSVFWADPYGILGGHFRLTRGHVGVINQSFGGADNGAASINALRQNIGVYGRVADRVLYSVNLSGNANDNEGQNAKTISALVDVDITDNIMFGAFGMNGQTDPMGGLMPKRDYSRYGVQFQADVSDARIQSIWVTASDDLAGGVGDEDNDAFSLQGFWTFRDDSLRPTWVPLVRYDHYEMNDGNNTFDELTLNLSYYFTQNVKGYIEYWDQIDTPNFVQDDNRWTLQFTAAF